MKVDEFCTYAQKSGIKAGDATKDGQYMFFTSSEDETKRYSDYLFDGEGIIMGTGGNATLHYYCGKYAVSTDCMVLIPDDRVRCKYLYYFFLENMSLLEAGFKGAGLKHTNKKYIGSIELKKIPSLEEQDAIISTLDKVSSIIQLRKQQIAKLDELIKSRFFEMFGDLKTNPLCFEKKKLKDTSVIVTGNTPSRAVPAYYGDYMEWIKTDNIITGRLHPSQATENLSEEGVRIGRIADKNSILMACIAGSVASIGRVCITDRRVAFNQQINAVISEAYDIFFLYVMLQLSKDYLVEEINMALKGILSKSKLEDKEFIIPPIELQKRFSSFAMQVEKSKAVVQQSLNKLETLKKALMQDYFG